MRPYLLFTLFNNGQQKLLVLGAFVHAPIIPRALAKCYFSNGTIVTDPIYEACPNVPTVCCALNRSNPPGGDIADGETADECLPNGVCQNRFVSNGSSYTRYYRDYCTEPNWESGKCLNICIENALSVPIAPCNKTSTSKNWCCGPDRDCCSKDSNLPRHLLPATLDVSFSPNRATSTSFASTSHISPPLSTSTSYSSMSTSLLALTVASASSYVSLTPTNALTTPSPVARGIELSTSAKVGIGVGVGIAAVVLIGLGFFVAKSLQRKEKIDPTGRDQTHRSSTFELQPIECAQPYYEAGSSTLYEMMSRDAFELSALSPPQEML
ncbi:uncharacterized protein BDR25DRAFT_123754 [Lindgomyces ingoldianus]|uniref:Uncharacterized protein n=1 Tax=Lindgomyces ingoldianus TaxID=673940 RepID=A0ACB6R357_9PLEO|nr:uncharacterized protein BDR25DRAFT_123754 [Lindgomyces ingoldianus]KAF2473535.1 hypothetical protein BDR25DRAFT_123754 [Lindgomyces ingoldianus]